jgi:hypothetical protein
MHHVRILALRLRTDSWWPLHVAAQDVEVTDP